MRTNRYNTRRTWKPKKLSPRHIEILNGLAQGLPRETVCKQYKYSVSTLEKLLQSTLAQNYLIELTREKQLAVSKHITTLALAGPQNTRLLLSETSAQAVEILVNIAAGIIRGPAPHIRLRMEAAKSILDRAGFGPISSNRSISFQVPIPGDNIELSSRALAALSEGRDQTQITTG